MGIALSHSVSGSSPAAPAASILLASSCNAFFSSSFFCGGDRFGMRLNKFIGQQIHVVDLQAYAAFAGREGI